jgi:putative hydrolase of the HAD superfamily
MSKNVASGVVFDAAGTLVDLRPSLAERVAAVVGEITGLDRNELAKALAVELDWPLESADLRVRRRRWIAFCRQLLDSLCATSGVQVPADDLRSAARRLAAEALDSRNYSPYLDVLPCLSALAARRIPIGLVSNFDDWLPEILNACEILDYFNCIVISGLEGFAKPDIRIFLAAAERLKIAPSRLLYVGDSPRTDIEGAGSAGMRTALIDRGDRLPGHPGTRIQSLDEILPLVGG